MDTRSLVKLTVGGAIVLGGLAFPPFLAGDGIVWGTMLATALASVAAGNTANAIDALTQGKESDRISLENEDLTKAVGKAIAAVITLAAKPHPRDTRNKLEKIAAQAKDNWVKIAQQELTQQRYPQLREAKLDEFLTPEEYSLTQNGNLTPQEWQDIFIRLNMAAYKGGGFQLPPEVYPQVAELLHTTFPKALRETLKEDFEKDGKAFAGLTLQLLTGMKAELAQLRNTNLGVNTAELTQILQQFQQLETQLRGTVAQQQAFFRQISQQIDSGFAEVCQQLGVMETNITGLLQNLEKRLDALDEKLTRLEAPRGRQLSKQEYRTRQALLSQMGTEVESRLAQSLHHAVPLNLGKEQQPHQVQRPWDVSVKVGEQRSFKLASETSILEVFENPAINGKFLILGKPGGGKTTTLLELAQALVKRAETDSDVPIPVILELSEWRTVTKAKFPDFWNKEKYDPSIKEWILSQLRSKGVSQEIGEQWIKEKELVLLLDGLDELPSERQAKCVRVINQFLDSEFSPLHLVVCSRKEEYEEYEEVLHLNGAICLEDLTVDQMRYYFASVNLGEFWESIKDSEKIVNFIRQPLFLAITSIAYQQIDVEEWRNCNTEKKAVDYLTGTFCKLLIVKKQEINKIVWLAKYMGEVKQQDFVLQDIQPVMLLDRKPHYKVTITCCGVIIFILFVYAILDYFWSYYAAILQVGLDFNSSANIISSLLYAACVGLLIGVVHVGIAFFLYVLTFQAGFSALLQEKVIITNEIQIFSFLGICSFLINLSIQIATCFVKIMRFSSVILIILSVIMFSCLLISFILFTLSRTPQDLQYLLSIPVKVYFWAILFMLCSAIIIAPISFSIKKEDNKLKKIIQKDLRYKMLVADFAFLTIFWFLYYKFLVTLTIKFVPLPASLCWAIPIIMSIYLGVFWGGGYGLWQHFIIRFLLFKGSYLPWNITRFLDYCTERLILQRVGNRYRFIHRLVQEHFANLEIQKE